MAARTTRRRLTGRAALGGAIALACGQSSLPDQGPAFPEPAIEWDPERYVAYRPSTPLTIDGRLDEPSWQAARWTAAFVDIEGPARPAPRHLTRVKMLWDSLYLYVGAELEEPDLWATLTQRDTVIYLDNDFEVFIDPDGDTHEYYELEINALGTVWDLFLVKPYRDGGPALHAWDIPGLRSAVHLDGTLNVPGDRDRGWSVEIAFPWSALREAAYRETPPRAGDQWRINFSRVQWRLEITDSGYVKAPAAEGDAHVEDNWVWSPQGLIDMHYPEMWGFVQFATDEVGSRTRRFEPDPRDAAAWALRRVYYKERTFQARNGRYTAQPSALGLVDDPPAPVPWPLRIVASPTWFEAYFVRGGDTVSVSADGRVR